MLTAAVALYVACRPQATTGWLRRFLGEGVMARFWVVGGEYADTSFERLAKGASEERHGPFMSYDEAYATWQARARATIDDALVRFRIVEEGQPAASRSAAADAGGAARP
jgi:hypothetical protein